MSSMTKTSAINVRPSRKQSQQQTRARLIEVGREHFLRYGLGGAIVEKIAEDAGFTRGALYANFSGRDDLFLAVIQSSADQELENFHSILNNNLTPQQRLAKMREAFGDLVANSGWMMLEVEFQANALRNDTVRAAFREHLDHRMKEGAALLRQFDQQLGVALPAAPEEIALVLGSLAAGMAARHTILNQTSLQQLRELAILCFDRIVSSPQPRPIGNQP